jgi:hypothetical protein
MCEVHTGLAPLVAIFRTNMAVEKESRRPLLILLHVQGLHSMLFHSLNLTLFCSVLCFEHVKSWLCELSKLLLLYLWRVYNLKTLRASLEKCTASILV